MSASIYLVFSFALKTQTVGDCWLELMCEPKKIRFVSLFDKHYRAMRAITTHAVLLK